MAQSLTTLNVEFASGVTQAMPMHLDVTTYYPIVHVEPSDLGGCSVHRFANAASNNATVVKSAAGVLYGFSVSGISPEVNYLKFYDVATSPTPGTTAIKMAFTIPKAAVATDGISPLTVALPFGVAFTAGIALALIESIADSGTTAMDTADELLVNVFYK
jgi:hypothetical protein